jgi:hypothetical protein
MKLKYIIENDSDKERWLEILAVLITGILKFVLMDWLDFRLFYVTAACLFWMIYIYRKKRRHPGWLRSWGFQKYNFKKSLLFLLPFVLLCIGGIIVYGLFTEARFLNWHVIPILILYPVWGLIQQFMMVGLVAGNLKKLSVLDFADWQIILFTSFLFAMVHYPSIPLMIFAFVMEIIFVRAYFKWPNLWSLGLYHGWIGGLFLYFVMGRDLWTELWVIFSST